MLIRTAAWSWGLGAALLSFIVLTPLLASDTHFEALKACIKQTEAIKDQGIRMGAVQKCMLEKGHKVIFVFEPRYHQLDQR